MLQAMKKDLFRNHNPKLTNQNQSSQVIPKQFTREILSQWIKNSHPKLFSNMYHKNHKTIINQLIV